MIAAAIQLLLTLCLGNREKTDLPYPSLPVAKEYILFSSCVSRFFSFISLSSWWRVALFIQHVRHVVLHHWSCALYTVFFNIIRSLYAIMHLHNLLPLHVWVTIFVDVVCCCTLIYFYFFGFLFPSMSCFLCSFSLIKVQTNTGFQFQDSAHHLQFPANKLHFFPALPTCLQ